jgi:DNA-binding transcriptional MerR regulator
MTAGEGELPFRRSGKSESAFRTISEVAGELDVPQHVLRFWEGKFPQVKPLKRGGGRRYYRPEDVTLLRRIRDLLYSEGYTIKGVQKLLREGGGREIVARSGEPDQQLPIAINDGEAEGEAPDDMDEEVAGDEEGDAPIFSTAPMSMPVRRELETILAELENLRGLLQPR